MREMDGSLSHADKLATDRGSRFSELQLRVGDRLQLQPPQHATDERCIVRLIGYVEDMSVLVTPPFRRGRRLRLFDGESLVVRAFTGRNAFGFETAVKTSVKHPFEYLHLAYPVAVQAVQVRNAIRVTTGMIASVSAYNREIMEPVPAIIANVSSTGALLDASEAVGEIGDLLRIVFRIRLHGVDSDLTVDALIRNRYAEYTQSGGVASMHHGVEFSVLEAADRMILKSLVYQQLVDNPRRSP